MMAIRNTPFVIFLVFAFLVLCSCDRINNFPVHQDAAHAEETQFNTDLEGEKRFQIISHNTEDIKFGLNKTIIGQQEKWIIKHGVNCKIIAALRLQELNSIRIFIDSDSCNEIEYSDDEILELMDVIFRTINDDIKVSYLSMNIGNVPEFKQDIMKALVEVSHQYPNREIVHGEIDGIRLRDFLAKKLSATSLNLKICQLSESYGHLCVNNGIELESVAFNLKFKSYADITQDYTYSLRDTHNVVFCFEVHGSLCYKRARIR